MTWLAIDPSFRNTGWAIMNEHGVYDVGLITTARDKALPVYLDNKRCLELIAGGLSVLLIEKNMQGSKVYMEAKGGSKSAKAASAMAMAQGVCIGALSFTSYVFLMLPQEVKKRVCGDRKASKDDIRAAVDKLYPEAFPMMVEKGYKAKKYNEHIYDAIAIGWAINQRENECE